MPSNIYIETKFSGIDIAENYLLTVPNEINNEVSKEIKPIENKTKRMIKSALTKGNGVDVGIYKKSIKFKDFSKSKDEINFKIGAVKPHYRLSHLLEHGHKMVPNKHFYRHVQRTKAIPHILPAQDYVDKAVMSLYEKAIEMALKGK